ncbi:uncharacterized protein LOC116799035 [Chiroxiphia lanceolata]|uniref:uncharacterized protein LOC116799035 n=1 Tax=Chiroxiphia lanceolata TaxID=296741 RepID=UPI0013CEF47F|nr:uncharacterized protein LOC116799035 [Chiroxiphia lanceolata]
MEKRGPNDPRAKVVWGFWCWCTSRRVFGIPAVCPPAIHGFGIPAVCPPPSHGFGIPAVCPHPICPPPIPGFGIPAACPHSIHGFRIPAACPYPIHGFGIPAACPHPIYDLGSPQSVLNPSMNLRSSSHPWIWDPCSLSLSHPWIWDPCNLSLSHPWIWDPCICPHSIHGFRIPAVCPYPIPGFGIPAVCPPPSSLHPALPSSSSSSFQVFFLAPLPPCPLIPCSHGECLGLECSMEDLCLTVTSWCLSALKQRKTLKKTTKPGIFAHLVCTIPGSSDFSSCSRDLVTLRGFSMSAQWDFYCFCYQLFTKIWLFLMKTRATCPRWEFWGVSVELCVSSRNWARGGMMDPPGSSSPRPVGATGCVLGAFRTLKSWEMPFPATGISGDSLTRFLVPFGHCWFLGEER